MEKRTPEIIDLSSFYDERGLVVVAEKLPFEIKRVFWVFGLEGYPRGGHAHRECHQILIPVKGKIFVTIDEMYNHVLFIKEYGLYVPPGNQIDMEFERDDDILLVIASEEFDTDDYIQ